jgi:hypothetical protein
MKRTLVTILAGVAFFGCERPTEPAEVRAPSKIVQVVLVDGLGDHAGILTSVSHVRVGTYYDFRPYDSLQITFTATRLATETPFDEILVRIGPTYCLRDSVIAAEQDVTLRVTVSDIAKSQSCALSFLTFDSRALLQLSRLRVVGWMLQ